jgi:hypothetical protein
MKFLSHSFLALSVAINTVGISLSPALSQMDNNGLEWATAANGRIPSGALEVGYQDSGPLYVCRVRYRGGLHPGKIASGFSGCNIGYGGREITVRQYEVLMGSDTPSAKQPEQASKPQACRNLSVEAFQLSDAIPNSLLSRVFLSDSEKATVRDYSLEIRNLALRCGCSDVAQTAEQLRKSTATNLVNRSSVRQSINRLQDIAQKCQ